MDADRNVNNAVYITYFHQSRLEHVARRGVWRPRGSQDDNLFALAVHTCRYLAPAFYGDVLSIWTATHAVGRISFQLVGLIWRESDGALIVAASVARWEPTAYIVAASRAIETYCFSVYRPVKDALTRLGTFTIYSGFLRG